MIDTILNLIPPPLLNAGGVAAFTVPCVWGLIERIMPPDTTALTNRLTNLGCNVGAFTLLHASNQVTFGPDWHGYLAAPTYGVLTAGLTEGFHMAMKAWFPSVTRPSGRETTNG